MPDVADDVANNVADRPLPLICRADLVCRQHEYQGRPYWVVKDPLAATYVRLNEPEYVTLQLLDGRSSLRQIKDEIERRFPTETTTITEIMHFTGTLHQSGLAIADRPGQAAELAEERDKQRRKKLLATFGNLLCLEFPGFDPDRILNRLAPCCRWCFSPWAVAGAALLGLAAAALVIVRFDEFQARLPTFYQFFTPGNAFFLLITLSVVKVFHEFGHGVAVKHYGGDCHEMGVMLLVFSPCLYCDASDSLLFPSKWQRAAVAAAGIFVELVLASIATFVWWYSQPGLLHHLALAVMFICSVGTVFVNGNPLMRYDGYFILSDLVEVPLLREKSAEIVQRKLGRWLLGIEPPHDPFQPRGNQAWFALYAVASEVYRWFVTVSIFWFLFKFLAPYRLEVFGRALAVASLYGLVVLPVWRFVKFLRVPGRTEDIRRRRVAWTLAGAAAVLVVIGLLPLPQRVRCPVEIQPRQAAAVYVSAPGTLAELCVQPGERVVQGQVLARLRDVDLELAISEIERQRDRLSTQLEILRTQRFRDSVAAAQVPEIEKSLASLEEQYQRRAGDLNRLLLRSPRDGVVIPPPETPAPPGADGHLPAWSGTPLDRHNLGCRLQEGTLLCHVGAPDQLWAELIVDQADIDFVRAGQPVRLLLDQEPFDALPGSVGEIARSRLKSVSRQLSNKLGGELATKTDAAGQEQPLSVTYQVRVPLEDPAGLIRPGCRGQAKIHVPPATIAGRVMRFVQQTLHAGR